jgi:hypothetical protein
MGQVRALPPWRGAGHCVNGRFLLRDLKILLEPEEFTAMLSGRKKRGSGDAC